MSTQKINQARSYARKRAVQLLYQWYLNPTPKDALLQEFSATQEMERVDMEYFNQLVNEVILNVEELDTKLEPYTDLELDKLDPIEHTILRLSLYELVYVLQMPYKVVINEAVNLAKTYGGEQGHAFVNAVLDKAVKEHRSFELKAKKV